jgi:hypothetical protein
MGIMAIVAASPLLGENAHLQAAPRGIAIMQIINIINLDVVNCAMGIISLVFLNEPEVRRYFRGYHRGGYPSPKRQRGFGNARLQEGSLAGASG